MSSLRVTEYELHLRVERFEEIEPFIWRLRSQEYVFARGWCTVKEARLILGPSFTRSLYPLLGEYLVYRRPFSRKVEILKSSVTALRDAIAANPSFWSDQAARASFRKTVLQAQCNLASGALHPG